MNESKELLVWGMGLKHIRRVRKYKEKEPKLLTMTLFSSLLVTCFSLILYLKNGDERRKTLLLFISQCFSVSKSADACNKRADGHS